MIILDTNVISEPFKKQPNPDVLGWIDRQNPLTLYLATVSLAEVLTGIARMPEGKNKHGLQDGVRQLFHRLFQGRVLPFDEAAAHAFANIQGQAHSTGRHIGVADGQIAAIALNRGFMVVTRDTKPYLVAGLEVLNPWDAAS
ncbi:type II toxin-antitoxin system VapC family toxin [Thauera butanivorans]|uniref:type II toxin-antitoxin system VapC family toxin n=1 Tax=Thauera butanivorans TaxID=86174 RepID=UPI000838EF5B|nr:type II toxin-antitoxin system VapC family toxin [Thauera butanivorans]